MNEQPFLSVDELLALDRMLIDARYHATVDRRAGRSHYADRAEEEIAAVQGVIDRHRAYVLRIREAWEVTG